MALSSTGGENLNAFDRKGVLYLYQNTLVVRSDKSAVWRVNAVGLNTTGETLDARNNILAAIPATPGALHSDLGLLGMDSYTLRKANAYFGRNWVPPGYLLNGYGNAGFKGHIAGLANLLVGQTYDPGFLNLVAGDYRLAAASEPTNQATRLAGTELAYPVDREYSAALHSTARPVVGAAFDLGAFEYGTYPPLSNPGDQHSLTGDQVQLSLVAIGADSFSASGLPPGLSINNTGQIRGTIDLQGEGTYTVVITARESGASSLASFTWIVAKPPNKMPTNIDLSSMIVADRTQAAVIGTVTVTDPDVGDTHTLAVFDGRFEISAGQLRLKANVSLDRRTEPTVAIDITAADNGGLSRTQTFVISVIAPSVIDDGDLGYLETGTGWYSIGWWTSGYQTDSRFVSPGDGRKTATWQQTVVPGSYTVQASWSGYHNNVSNAPYRIYDGNRLLAEVRVDQKQTPSYPLGALAAFLTLATVDIVSGSLRVVLGNDASGGILVVADAVRIVPGMITSPPSVVAGPGVVDDGEAGYTESAYGWYSIAWWTTGYHADSRFVNAGDGRSTATWEQTLVPGSYTIQASWFGYHNNVSNAPYRIYDGDRLLAEVRVDQQRTPSYAAGDPAPFLTLATVDITSGSVRVVLGNDASGGTLVVADAVRIVPGTIVLPPSVVAGPGVVDDGEAGYTESAYGWYSIAWWTTGYHSDSRFVNAGDGRSTATWEQTLAPGNYTIQASWFGYHNNVSNAPYRIYDGDRLVAEVRVDQKKTPAAVPGDPVPFQTLATLKIASGTVRVVLGNDASGGTLVVADAVRVLPTPIAPASVVVAAAPVVAVGQTGYLVSVSDNLVVSVAQARGQELGGMELASAANPITIGELPMTTTAVAWIPPAGLENLRKILERWGETPDILDDLGGSH
ncbi:MAG: putative Ig domain-containing protein [Planctomycetota bacterium]|nr:putative Ig domain-containing protein [Planctomycetota bacterium]